MELLIDILGYSGCFLISILLLPQIYHTYKEKKTKSLSYIFLFIGLFTAVLMIFYSYLIDAKPILIANIAYFFGNLSLIIMKFKYDKLYLSMENNEEIKV